MDLLPEKWIRQTMILPKNHHGFCAEFFPPKLTPIISKNYVLQQLSVPTRLLKVMQSKEARVEVYPRQS